MYPIWWCITKQEVMEDGRYYARRIVLAIPTTIDQASKLYDEYVVFIKSNPGTQSEYFVRDPDVGPLVGSPDHLPY